MPTPTGARRGTEVEPLRSRRGPGQSARPGLIARLEPVFFALFLASWLGALLQYLRVFSWAGSIELQLYPLFGFAAGLGWTVGNVFVWRRRQLPPHFRWRAWLSYFFGPPGVLYLWTSMAPAPIQLAAPYLPLLASAVYSVFFLVPVTLQPRPRPR